MTSSSRMAKSRSQSLKLLLLAVAALCCAAPLAAQTFTSFDAPDAGHGVIQGTVPWAINQHGVIAGYYIDSSNLVHGFVRTSAGSSPNSTPRA